MKWIRSVSWGAVGALPGAILFALPAFIESQAENLALILGGLALAIIGFLVGALAGSQQVAAKRRGIALGAVVGGAVGALLFYGFTFLELQGIFGLAALVISTIVGSVMGSRRSPPIRSRT